MATSKSSVAEASTMLPSETLAVSFYRAQPACRTAVSAPTSLACAGFPWSLCPCIWGGGDAISIFMYQRRRREQTGRVKVDKPMGRG